MLEFKRLILILVFVCTNVLYSYSQKTVINDDWGQKATPASEGVDEQKLFAALEYLKSKSSRDGIGEVVIVRNGKIIYEGTDATKKHSVYSCSKSFTSTVLGLLVAEKRIGLDDYASKYEPALSELYPKVTFRHFVTMTSGYSATGRSRWAGENADWSLTPYSPEKPHFSPGSQFEYWDEAQMMFGKVLTNVLGRTMKEYLTEKITDPIGMGFWEWETEQSSNGVPVNNGCTGVRLNAIQLARFGQLFLNKGEWNGKQLLPANWVEMATANQVPVSIPVFMGDRASSKGSGSYGFNWWVNSRDGLSKMPDAPLKVAYMSGKNHNVCCIIPEWNMIIVRMGDDENPKEGKPPVWNEFLKKVGQSIYSVQETNNRKLNFPKQVLSPEKLPSLKNTWVFIMAGQSNMAGRGLVEPQDTLPDNRILTINSKGNIIVAKEPLHFYEPTMSGLDCGLSFAKTILKSIPDSITILMIPTAVGGSSIDQWLGDSIHRTVKLLTNFREKVDIARKYGEVKGIIWHQGESDSNPKLIGSYEGKLRVLHGKFRDYVNKPDLPVIVGEVGIFTDNAEYKKLMNQTIHHFASTEPNTACVVTSDFKHKGDKLHFDSQSQRTMGMRMAYAWLNLAGIKILENY